MQHIIILSKSPDPSRSKTRLRPLGTDAVFALSKAMLRDVISGAQRNNLQKTNIILACDPHTNTPFFKTLAEETGVTLINQPKGDLGERLIALSQQYSRGPTLFLGSDCPHLPSTYLEDAFKSLSDHDVCLAPATDGGYVLIAQKQTNTQLFTDIPWSTNRVFEITKARATTSALTIKQLPVLWDIDKPEDLVKLWSKRRQYTANHTVQALQTHCSSLCP